MKTPTIAESALISTVIEAGLTEPWNALPPSHRKRWVDHVGEAQEDETRLQRIEKLLAALRGHKQPKD